MDKYMNKMIDAVNDAVGKINGLNAEDSLIFPIFTDLHTTDVDHEYMDKLIPVLKLITDKLEYDAVINLGDNFGMLGRDIHITNDELKTRFERVFSAVYDAVRHPVINVNGNHDAPGTDFFQTRFLEQHSKG